MNIKYDVTITTSKGEEVFFGLDRYPAKDGDFLSLKKGGRMTLIRIDDIIRIDVEEYEN